MVDLRGVYRQAEEHITLVVVGLFILVAIMLAAQAFFSPLVILSGVIGVAAVIVTFLRPTWSIAFLAFYLPFEPFLLKFVPDEIYLFARFFSEILVYVLVLSVAWKILEGKIKMRQTPLGLPFVLFVLVLVAAAVINVVPPTIAILGLRQILRFMLIFFVVAYLNPSNTFIKRLTYGMFLIVIFQSILGIIQSLAGGALDSLLLPSDARSFGEIAITSGVIQFWDAGSRVFATLGRYDRLGNFLYFFLLIGVGFIYEKRLREDRSELFWMFALGLPTLILTFSRSSWFAFLLGFMFIGLLIRKDKRVLAALITFMIVVSGYLAISGLNVRFLTEAPGQTVVERFFESFSFTRWQGEYYGLGRTFWMVQTPMTVVPAAPVFGFGPGQFGGGAVSALRNTAVYDQLGLPFGVFGTDGYIDNSWFSLWGESGTLGMVFYLWMYIALFRYSLQLYRDSHEGTVRAIAIGFAAVLIAIAFNALLSTILEIRTTAFYLWLYAGFIFVMGQRVKKDKKGSPRL